MRFEGTKNYVATDDLTIAVNAAVTLERPLLVKGEPGTGKTELARQVARALGMEMIEWHIKSTTKAQQGLYEYDAVSRLRDSQLGDTRVHDVDNYIRKGKLWQAFTSDKRVVLLIDEEATEENQLLEALASGARGFLDSKRVNTPSFSKMVKAVDKGEAWVSRKLHGEMMNKILFNLSVKMNEVDFDSTS